MQFAAQSERITQRTLDSEDGLWPVALAIEETMADTDTKRFTRLLKRAISGSQASLRASSRRLWKTVGSERKRPDAEEAVDTALEKVEADHELHSTLDAFSAEVWKESDHLIAVEQRFVEKVAETAKRYWESKGKPAEE